MVEKMSEIQRSINDQLFQYFQGSEMYKQLRHYGQSKQAKGVIHFNPHEDPYDPKTFYFQVPKLRKACPQLAQCGPALTPLLIKSGMTVRPIIRQKFKTIKFTAASHQKLTLHSPPLQIMQVWQQAQTINFVGRNCILSKLYNAIQSNNKYVQWNSQGQALITSGSWEDYKSTTIEELRRFGFDISCAPEICHPLLNKWSPVKNWFLVYMRKIVFDRTALIKKKKERRERKKGVAAGDEEGNNNGNSEEVGMQQQQQQQQGEEEVLQCMEVSKIPYKELRAFRAFGKISEFSGSFKKNIETKVTEMKASLAMVQKQNVEMQLGGLFILLDQIKQTSILQKGQIFTNPTSPSTHLAHPALPPSTTTPPTPPPPILTESQKRQKKLTDQIQQLKDLVTRLQQQNRNLRTERATDRMISY